MATTAGSGEEVTLDEVDAGGIFGFASLLEGTTHQTTATATGECRCIEVSRDALRHLVHSQPDAGLDMLAVLGRHLHQAHKLVAQPEQIRNLIQEQAQSYEEPEQVVQWYYQSPERMQEIESLALEENVVAWVAGQAQVEDVTTSFEELMGRA